MPTIKNITKDASKAVESVTDEATRVATDPTPLYAAVGLTDTVVERAREAVTETVARANKVGKALSPKNVSAKATEVSKAAESLPTKAVNDVTEGLGKVQDAYADLAKRGEGLVGRVKKQQATKDLTKQVNTVVEQGKQLLGTASKGVTDTRSAAKATVTKGRRQAAEVVADVVAGEDVTVAKKPAASKKAATSRTTATKKAATKKAATKPASKAAATKSTTAKATATKPATKAAATKAAATKSTATKPATKAAATKSTTSTTTAKAAADKSTTTTAAAKRTATTARNAATKTVEATQDVVSEAPKTAEKVVEAVAATAAKVGD